MLNNDNLRNRLISESLCRSVLRSGQEVPLAKNQTGRCADDDLRRVIIRNVIITLRKNPPIYSVDGLCFFIFIIMVPVTVAFSDEFHIHRLENITRHKEYNSYTA